MRFGCGLGESTDRIYAPCLDSSGTLWYETYARLRCITSVGEQDFPHLDSEFGVRITSIAQVDKRTLAIASAGGGVKLVRDGQVMRTPNSLSK